MLRTCDLAIFVVAEQMTPASNQSSSQTYLVVNIYNQSVVTYVTVMGRSRSRVPRGGGLALLPHLVGHLLPQLYHRHVM
jgi:hypothetical protein